MSSIKDKSEEGLERFQEAGGNLEEIGNLIDSGIDNLLNDRSGEFSVPKRKLSNRWWLLFFLLIAIGSYWLYEHSKEGRADSESMYSTYYVPLADVVTDVKRGGELDVADTGLAAYNQGRYEEAIAIWGNQPRDYSDVYTAVAYLETERPLEAIEILEKLIAVDSEYSDIEEWYLALAYLKIGDIDDARLVLTGIKEKRTYKSRDAEAILDALN